ncbi:hypothetical protein AB0G05_19925 [Nonomuraea wenchangensis]
MPNIRPAVFQSPDAIEVLLSPSTSQPGDLLLAFVSYESGTFDAELTGGTPEWQLLTSKFTTAGGVSDIKGLLATGIWWKPAAAADSSWALDLGEIDGTYMVSAVVAVTDALLTAPQFTVSADQTASTNQLTTVTSPAGPSPAIGDLELRWVAGDNYPTSQNLREWNAPAQTSEVVDLNGSYVTGTLTSQTLTAASSPSRNHTLSNGGVFAAHGFTLRIRSAAVLAPGAAVLAPAAAAQRAASW